MPNSELELRRLEITDGFMMPGFKGRYFMWPEEYWLLSKYLDMTQGSYLEVGSMCGIIAMSFAEKYPHRQFVCVDKFSAGHGTIAGDKETFLHNLREHKLKNVTLVEGDSLAVVPELSQKFDIVFIDANHAYDYVLADALNSWGLLSPGGFVAFHDYGYVEETTRAVEEFLRRTGGCFWESTSSLAVVQKQAIPIRAGLHKYMQSQHQHLLKENTALKQSMEKIQDHLRDENAALKQSMERIQDDLRNENIALKQSMEKIQDDLCNENTALKQSMEKIQDDNDWLLSSIKTHEEDYRQLAMKKRDLEILWEKVQNSAGWRMLNKWRSVRDRLAPPDSLRRRWYDLAVGTLRGR